MFEKEVCCQYLNLLTLTLVINVEATMPTPCHALFECTILDVTLKVASTVLQSIINITVTEIVHLISKYEYCVATPVCNMTKSSCTYHLATQCLTLLLLLINYS